MTFRVLGDGLPVEQIGGLEFYPKSTGVAFSPSDIAGLLLWLKADAGTFQDAAKTTPAASDGDVIGAWEDQSGNGNDVLQSTTANKPLLKLAIVNGEPVIRFDGVNDFLSVALDLALSASDNLTIFTVNNPVATVNTKAILGNLNNAGDLQGLQVRHDESELLEFVSRKETGQTTVTAAPDPDTDFVIGTGVLDAGAQRLYRDSVLQDSGVQRDMTGNNTSLFVGKNRENDNNEYNGDIAEIIIYDAALSDVDRAAVENYLNARYDIWIESPTEIAGLEMWLKADAGTFQDAAKTTPAVSDGDVIGAWADQSGNGNDVLQAVTANKPLLKLNIVNSLPVIRFDGIDDLMASAAFAADLSQPNILFIVMETRNAEDDQVFVFDGIDAAKAHRLFTRTGVAPDDWRMNAGSTMSGSDATKNAVILVTTEFNGVTSRFWENVILANTANTGAEVLSGLTLGASLTPDDPLDGDIVELLLYNAALSDGEIHDINTYLNRRYAIF